jgi:hypothetical protein
VGMLLLSKLLVSRCWSVARWLLLLLWWNCAGWLVGEKGCGHRLLHAGWRRGWRMRGGGWLRWSTAWLHGTWRRPAAEKLPLQWWGQGAEHPLVLASRASLASYAAADE